MKHILIVPMSAGLKSRLNFHLIHARCAGTSEQIIVYSCGASHFCHLVKFASSGSIMIEIKEMVKGEAGLEIELYC